MKTALIALLVLALFGGTCAAVYHGGRAAGVDAMLDKVTAAKSAETLATTRANANDSALDEVRAALLRQKNAATRAQANADKALAQRDTAQAALASNAHARETSLRKLAHESPDCAALAAMPVCPAVARRLFGQPAAAAARPGD